MRTEEGQLKYEFDQYVKTLKNVFNLKYVPTGYGSNGVDRFLCIQGRFVAIELKAKGNVPTSQQNLCLREVRDAGGVAFWADNMDAVRWYLNQFEHADNVNVERLVMPETVK